MTDTSQVGAGWYPDPSGAHELRYWAQGSWQASVSDANRVTGDPLRGVTYPPPGTAHPPAAAVTSSPPMAHAPAPPMAAGSAPSMVEAPSRAATSLPAPTIPPAPPTAPPQHDPARTLTGEVPSTSVFEAPPTAPVAVPPAGSPAAAGLSPTAIGRSALPMVEPAGRRLRTGAPATVAVAAFLLAVQATGVAILAIALAAAADLTNDLGDALGSDTNDTGSLRLMGAAAGGVAVLMVATSIGLAMTARWARAAALALAVVAIAAAVATSASSSDASGLTGAIVPVGIVVLVLTPSAARAFRRGPVDETAVAP